MTLLISHKRSVNSRVTISCSYLTIVIGKWCSFLEASCLNRRPGRGTSGTASLSSSLASKLERGSSSGAYPPFTTAFNTSRSILASRARETCVVLTTRVRSNKAVALFKYSTTSTISSFVPVQIRAISVLIRPCFRRRDGRGRFPKGRVTFRFLDFSSGRVVDAWVECNTGRPWGGNSKIVRTAASRMRARVDVARARVASVARGRK